MRRQKTVCRLFFGQVMILNNKILITEIPAEALKRFLKPDKENQKQKIRFVCLMSEKRMLEAHCEYPDREEKLGNIYVGRVQKVVKNINAAFIEIAPGLSCYYPMEQKSDPVYVRKMPSPRLVQGDELLVQLQKEGVRSKAPEVTANLSLSGRYAVLTSGNKTIGFSGKFSRKIRDRFQELTAKRYQGEYGLIIRTNAAHASDEEVLSEIGQLCSRMDTLIRTAGTRAAFSCVYRAVPKYMAYLQNSRQEQLSEIVTDLEEIYAQILQYRTEYPAFDAVPVRLYEDKMFPLAKACNLEREISRALERRVWLNSGGYLVIEPTEAMTVIDVNTGKSTSKKDPQEHFLKLNLEAAREIAVQLRLRNISGIVIVDFIDLIQKERRNQVMEELRRAVREDPIPVQVLDMTRLNLVELTRKKVEKSLAEQLT